MATEKALLFVSRLPWTVCRLTLRKHFQNFGELKATRVSFDPHTGRSLNFGFVEFETMEGAQKALETTPHIVEGKEILVRMSNPSENSNQKHKKPAVSSQEAEL